jgi:hypothetical protein
MGSRLGAGAGSGSTSGRSGSENDEGEGEGEGEGDWLFSSFRVVAFFRLSPAIVLRLVRILDNGALSCATRILILELLNPSFSSVVFE